jgi:hypothetical protein
MVRREAALVLPPRCRRAQRAVTQGAKHLRPSSLAGASGLPSPGKFASDRLMQLRKSSLQGDRPVCPLDPNHKIHRHDEYERYGNCDDKKPLIVVIFRFRCVRCRRTLSVLPDDLLPYRAVPAPLVEKPFDALAKGTPKPAATEKEKGCLKRAWASFSGRIEPLIALLGQMIRPVKPCAADLWLQLRQWGNLTTILVQLAEPFKTSLLGDYRCLKPWPL